MQTDGTGQTPEGVDFRPENGLIDELKRMAGSVGLRVVPPSELDSETRSVADLVLARDHRCLLFAKRRKVDNRRARIDVDSRPRPRHVMLEKEDGKDWEAMTDSRIPIERWAPDAEGLRRLADLMLAP